jgi:hypothetical protein
MVTQKPAESLNFIKQTSLEKLRGINYKKCGNCKYYHAMLNQCVEHNIEDIDKDFGCNDFERGCYDLSE